MSDAPTSPLDQLRSRRAAMAQERHIDLDLPGYLDLLVARYRPLEWKVIHEIQARAKGDAAEAELNAAADLLIQACERIFMRRDGVLVPLEEVTDELGSEPVRFDENLAKATGVEDSTNGTARSVAKAVIPNEIALIEHQAYLLLWMRSANSETDQDF